MKKISTLLATILLSSASLSAASTVENFGAGTKFLRALGIQQTPYGFDTKFDAMEPAERAQRESVLTELKAKKTIFDGESGRDIANTIFHMPAENIPGFVDFAAIGKYSCSAIMYFAYVKPKHRGIVPGLIDQVQRTFTDASPEDVLGAVTSSSQTDCIDVLTENLGNTHSIARIQQLRAQTRFVYDETDAATVGALPLHLHALLTTEELTKTSDFVTKLLDTTKARYFDVPTTVCRVIEIARMEETQRARVIETSGILLQHCWLTPEDAIRVAISGKDTLTYMLGGFLDQVKKNTPSISGWPREAKIKSAQAALNIFFINRDEFIKALESNPPTTVDEFLALVPQS